MFVRMIVLSFPVGGPDAVMTGLIVAFRAGGVERMRIWFPLIVAGIVVGIQLALMLTYDAATRDPIGPAKPAMAYMASSASSFRYFCVPRLPERQPVTSFAGESD